MAGQVSAGPPDRKLVGLTADAGFGVARNRASEVHREMDFDSIGKVVAGRFPEQAIKALEKSPKVRYVEDDQVAQAFAQSLPWGVDRVDADVVHGNGETGNGADIAILDTGIDEDHPDLQANLGAGKAYAVCDGSNGATCNNDWDDDNGHGTHCAGIADALDNTEGVVGVSTEATLHAVKVLASDGSGSYSDIAAGIEYVANQGWDVASLSLGGGSGNSTLKDAVQYAQNNGVLLVAAAGNDYGGAVSYPAAYSEVVAVSSTNKNDGLSNFSNVGPEIELAAPGSDVNSTYVGGGYDTLSGTSMACPHVSGAAGQLMANGKSNSEARQTMKNTAEDIGLTAEEQGSGLLDVEAALSGDDGGGGDPVLSVSTDSASSVGTDNATLNGTLGDLGGASSADVYFEWRQSGASSWNVTSTQTLSATGSFSENISGLSSSTDYEFRAIANASDGDSDTGTTRSFTTDSSGGCFITTATAGEGPTLDSLRRFRDDSMATTPLGRALVGLYYRISPPIAETLDRHPESRTSEAVRSLVDLCADLSDAQDETDSRAKSVGLGVALTNLYMVGIAVAAAGHTGLRAGELLDDE